MAEDLLVIPFFLPRESKIWESRSLNFWNKYLRKCCSSIKCLQNNVGEPTRNPDSQQPPWSQVMRICMEFCLELFFCTVEIRFTDTRLILTPRYYGQFALSLGKALTFSLNSTHLIRTPVNRDNGHLRICFLPNRKPTSLKRTLHYQLSCSASTVVQWSFENIVFPIDWPRSNSTIPPIASAGLSRGRGR